MRAWLERSFRNRIFLTVLLVALVPLLLCDVLMTQMMIFRSEHTLRTDAQEEMALLTTQLDALLTDCGDVTRALAGSTVTRSALRRGGSDSRTLYQLLNRSTVALREYADFEVYGEDGDCLYTTANVWPAAQSTGWGILSAARAADGVARRKRRARRSLSRDRARRCGARLCRVPHGRRQLRRLLRAPAARRG